MTVADGDGYTSPTILSIRMKEIKRDYHVTNHIKVVGAVYYCKAQVT